MVAGKMSEKVTFSNSVFLLIVVDWLSFMSAFGDVRSGARQNQVCI
jgi:hypothetical protein